MIRFLVNRPIGVIMSYIAVIILGVVAMKFIPISLLPDIPIPEITIQITAPEKSVNEIEQNYISPIRRQMLQLSHLEDIESTSFNGHASIILRFKQNANINYAFVEVNEKIDGLMYHLPSEFERPRIVKASSTDIPVLYLSISLKNQFKDEANESFIELSEFSDQIIKRRIEQLPEVAMVDVSGLVYPEVEIYADLDKLNQLGINYKTIENVLSENNISLGNIQVRNGIYIFNVKYSSVLKSRQDIESICIKVGDRIFRLNELVQFKVKAKGGSGVFLSYNEQAIIMALIKKSDTRLKSMKNELDKLLTTLRKDYPRLNFEVSRNQTKLLDYSISNLRNSLFIGGIIAVIIVFLFFNDIKPPILIGVVIPISLVISLFVFYLVGLSINIISLSGLILGIGMMIDNSIIVVDNISQYKLYNNSTFKNGIILGTKEVMGPLFSSVLTTCAVFLPLMFLSGITGALFYDQAIAITIGLGVSLIVSITLIPVLYATNLKKHNENNNFNKNRGLHFLIKRKRYINVYETSFKFIFKHRNQFLIGTFVFFIIGVFAFFMIPKERFPMLVQRDAIIEIDWNQNIGIEESRRRLEPFIDQIDSLTTQLSCLIGPQLFIFDKSKSMSREMVSIYFNTNSDSSFNDVMYYLKDLIDNNFPEAIYRIKSPESVFEKIFQNKSVPLEVHLWQDGIDQLPNPEVIKKINKELNQEFDLNTHESVPMQEYYELSPNFDLIKLYNISISNLIQTLKKTMSKLDLYTLKQGQSEVPVVIKGQQQDIYSVIKSLRIETENGGSVPVDQLIQLNKIIGYKLIKGGKHGSYISLDYDLSTSNITLVKQKVMKIINNYPRLHVELSGTLFGNKSLFRELLIVLFIALLLLYFILAAQFNSFVQPLILFVEIPIALAGALILLWITNNSLNIMSIIGLIVMLGIVVNDSILKVTTINNLIIGGNNLLDAIHKAGKRRIKSILMTSITTILAMVPLLWGKDFGSTLQRPLAYAIIGGMVFGTFVSLYFVPIIYFYFYNIKNNINKN